MVNRNTKFREEWGHDKLTGKKRTRFAANVGNQEVHVFMEVDEWEGLEVIAAEENRALAELEEKIKIEVARQSEAALGFGYVGG